MFFVGGIAQSYQSRSSGQGSFGAMDTSQAKRPRITVEESSSSCAEDSGLRIMSDTFGSSIIWDSQQQLWLERVYNRKFWGIIIRTDDGHEIICSKKDLVTFSDFFLAMFSNDEYREASSNDLFLPNTSGKDFEVLLSLHYLKEKVCFHLSTAQISR